MDSQRGTCTSCNHSFRLPVRSSAEEVRCPNCGGVVALGATPGATRPARATARGRVEGKTASAAVRAARSHGRTNEKRGTLPLVLGGVGVVGVALAVWFFGSRGTEEVATTNAAEVLPSIDLSRLTDRPPLEGTTDADWGAMNELMTRYRTPPFGPASAQCGDRLMIKGKRAVPAILNGFKRVDLTTPEGAEIGWKIQTLLLQGLCNDANFGWHRETRPADILFNQQVVQRWFQAWEIAGEDDEIWAEIARLKDIPPDLLKPGAGSEVSPDEKER